MSDWNTALSTESAETLTTEPTESGQVGNEGATESGAQPNYLDVESNRDAVVKVTVDGQEIEVPLSEALSGYSRQADYTRKTQELAAQRQSLQYAEALARAYENNPQETVRLLAQSAGISLAEARQQVADAQDAQTTDWDEPDPRLSVLEQRIQQFELSQARTELERTIGTMQQRYGNDFNPSEVVNEALARGTTDLEGVYKTLAFDRMLARSQAVDQATANAADADAKATAAKQALGETVQSGGSAAGAGGFARTSPTSVAEAFALAEAEHGAFA